MTDAIAHHYNEGRERARLTRGAGQLEARRTCDLLDRFLPPAPAEVLDVGGGPGFYACWLAQRGYQVHLRDLVPLHLHQARDASDEQPASPLASIAQGNATDLAEADASFDAVLLFGPLYHLQDEDDRIRALREAYRVLRPGGIVMAVGISRFASSLDGLFHGLLEDPLFRDIAARDLVDGCHHNPTNHPHYFTTAFFHQPESMVEELRTAGFGQCQSIAIEGPAWLLGDFDAYWANDERRERLVNLLRRLESEPSILGVSAHLMGIGVRSASC